MAFKEIESGSNEDGVAFIEVELRQDSNESKSGPSLTVLDLRKIQERSGELMPPPLLFLAAENRVLIFQGNQMEKMIDFLENDETIKLSAVGMVDFGLSKNTLVLKPLPIQFPINGIYIQPDETNDYLEKHEDKIKRAFGLESV